MTKPEFIPYKHTRHTSDDEMLNRSKTFYDIMNTRRTIRQFSDQVVPRKIVEHCLMTAGTAPSGANQQPWKFVVVADSKVKAQIRAGAEKEEREFYSHRASDEWLDSISHLGTNASKPFLETAPILIVVFEEKYGLDKVGNKSKRYYPTESVGLATGLLITALHHAGLASLTHTPSPMAFLNNVLDVPINYKPFLILVAGHPVPDVTVPNIKRKTLSEIAEFR